MMQTSLTHPLRIDELRVEGVPGVVGLTFCPGKVQAGALTGAWARDLAADLAVVRAWGAAAIVNLLEPHELTELQVPTIEATAHAVLGNGLIYAHAPIRDSCVPSAEFDARWQDALGPLLRATLRSGGRVLVFCMGGLGRTGTVAARLLVELGCSAADAIDRVRDARPGAIESRDQVDYVMGLSGPSTQVSPQPSLVDRVAGGLVGSLVGDALGVPYEFHSANDLPAYDRIDVVPPLGFHRAHTTAPPGTWSDDGAQALCLLESLLECGHFDIADFASRVVRWLDSGHLAVDKHVFDVGGVTHAAIVRLRNATPSERSGGAREADNGNGSLMRVLPLALWHRGRDEELVELAHRQSVVTHAHPRSQVACALYCLVARAMLASAGDALAWAQQRLWDIYATNAAWKVADYPTELARISQSGLRDHPTGGGYVVDTFWSAMRCLQGATYEDVVRAAVAMGNDTDTTACVAGGLAGIRFGIEGIPRRWREALRGREILTPLCARLLAGLP